MKIAFFSDIHGNIYSFNSFLEDICNININKVIFCGDIFGYYYYCNDIINKIRENNFFSILGNHDKMFLDIIDKKIDEVSLINKYGNSYRNIVNKISISNIQYLRTLNTHFIFKCSNKKIAVFHGSPYNELDGRIYPDTKITNTELYEKYDYVILGHTHHKMVKKTNNTIILNPGSLGQQRDGKGTSYLILDLEKNNFEFRIVRYNVNDLIKDIDLFDYGNNSLKEVLLRKR